VAGTVTFIGVGGTEAKVIDGSTNTGWVSSASVAVNSDIYLTGSSSISDKVSAATVTGYGLGAGLVGEPWNFSSGGGDEGNHIFMIANIGGSADTLANGGFGIIAADDLGTDSFGTWYVGPQGGSLSGWEYFVIDPAKDFDVVTAGSGGWTTTGNPAQLSGVDGIGVRWKVLNSIMGASDNCFLQSMSIGVGYRVTGAGCLFSDFSTYEQTNRYGALQTKSGTLFPLGKLRVGIASGAGNTTMTDSGFTVIWQGQTRPDGTTKATAVGFYGFYVDKGSGTTTVDLSNGSMAAASPEYFDLVLAGGTTVTITNLQVDRARLVTLDTAVSWTGGQVSNSGAITAAGAVFTGVKVLTPIVAADTSAVIWNVATDPDGYLDDCSFSKGTNAHHAIELGLTSPTTVTLRGIDFSGFNASNGNNDSTIHVLRTTGTVTINLVGCSGNISYKSAGATVVLVTDPVTLDVHIQDANTGSPISGVRVWVPVTSSAGGRPYLQSISSITRSGSTATVTTGAAHGLSTNDYVDIADATEQEYNGTFQITVTGTTTFTYTVTGTPTTPAGGTKTVTFVVVSGLTDGSGDISATYSWNADQPVSGRARKGSSAPYYKTSPISGTISSTAGLAVTVQMIPDA
jgi:hypothetical protein